MVVAVSEVGQSWARKQLRSLTKEITPKKSWEKLTGMEMV